MSQRVGGKSYKDFETCHFTRDVRGLMVSSMLGHFLLGRRDVAASRSLTRKKEAQSLLGIFGFLRKHILHLQILLLPTYWVTWKVASFEWGSEQERKSSAAGPDCDTNSSSAWTLPSGRG